MAPWSFSLSAIDQRDPVTKFFDRKGEKISTLEWAMKYEDFSYRQVARDNLPNGFVISTIWVGFDFTEDHTVPPLIFETMIKKPDGKRTHIKYSEEQDAEYGHRAAVQYYGEYQDPPDDAQGALR